MVGGFKMKKRIDFDTIHLEDMFRKYFNIKGKITDWWVSSWRRDAGSHYVEWVEKE